MAQIEVAFSDRDKTFDVHACPNPRCVYGNRLVFEMPSNVSSHGWAGRPGVFTYPIWIECQECGMGGPKAYGVGHLEHYEEAVEYWNDVA